MTDPSDYDICDEHEISYLKGGYCFECRIADLETGIKECQRYMDNTYLGINPDPEGEYFLVTDVLAILKKEL